jgi:Mu-like prophage tail sheath protein gpL
LTNNQRPGVYSSYTVSSGYTSPRSAKKAALVCAGRAGLIQQGQSILLSSARQASEYLDAVQDAAIWEYCQILFESGVSGVVLACVQGNYAPALEMVGGIENIGVLLCDATQEAALGLALESVCRSSENGRERVLFAGAGSAGQATQMAGWLNHERAVVCAPGAIGKSGEARALSGACALAGAVLAANSAAYNFSGCAMEALRGVQPLSENEIQSMLQAGASVLEEQNGVVQCVRAVTSRTRAGGADDLSMRSLNSILVIDTVMQSVRDCLKERMRGTQSLSYQSVATQVLVELAELKSRGLIVSYSPPLVSADGSDPSVCIVDLAFCAAQMVNQVHITAHISL